VVTDCIDKRFQPLTKLFSSLLIMQHSVVLR